jgi:hypothetical protein
MHVGWKHLTQSACRKTLEPLERRMLLAVGVLDTVVFGNTSSETAHTLAQTQSQTIAGSLGQSARQLLPLSTLAVDGGSMTFNMTVDPVKRNYFSVKLWGEDDTDQGKGRLYLYVPSGGTDYQVGYRHEGDYMPISVTAGAPPLSGRFFYSTTLLPLSMTAGHTSLALKIQSTGELYGLGSGGPPSGNYQFNMDTASRGIYRAYTHTAPYLDVSDEAQGSAPATTTRPTPTESSVLGAAGTYTNGLNNWINGKLSAAITAFTATDVELLARSYFVSQLSAGYQNANVVSKVIAVIDGFASDYYTNPSTSVTTSNYGADGGNEVWGGRFGAIGWGIHMLAAQLDSSLDVTVNYGTAGGNKTRRVAWGDMLRASRDSGRFNRDGKYLTNQALIADTNIYKANRAMIDIAASGAFTETAARRYIKEAIGIIPWTGSDLSNGLSSYKYGTNYYQVTPDGLTKEWGFPGAYGEMQYFAATFYKYTNDTAVSRPGDQDPQGAGIFPQACHRDQRRQQISRHGTRRHPRLARRARGGRIFQERDELRRRHILVAGNARGRSVDRCGASGRRSFRHRIRQADAGRQSVFQPVDRRQPVLQRADVRFALRDGSLRRLQRGEERRRQQRAIADDRRPARQRFCG